MMPICRSTRRHIALAGCISLVTASCGFQGLNSLPLPGAVGRGSDAVVYHVQLANVGSLEQNSPVMMGDVVVGSVGKMTVDQWHAEVEVSVEGDVAVPANAHAAVGQTSLLGSMHLALDPPLGEAAQGRLTPGATIPLDETTTYPSTERTLSTLSTVVNAGGLGQVGDVVHSFSVALNGRQSQARELIGQLDRLLGVFDGQRADVIASIQALGRLSQTLATQNEVIHGALLDIPPALDVLIDQRPQITTALEKLGAFSDLTVGLVNDTQNDLVTNLKNLDPTLKALADVGPDIDIALGFLPVLPFGQNLIDRGIKGDYMNLFATLDLTVPRLKRTLFSGTRFGDEHALLVPAPGDPGYDQFYSSDPLGAPLRPRSDTPLPATPPTDVPRPSAEMPSPAADDPAGGP